MAFTIVIIITSGGKIWGGNTEDVPNDRRRYFLDSLFDSGGGTFRYETAIRQGERFPMDSGGATFRHRISRLAHVPVTVEIFCMSKAKGPDNLGPSSKSQGQREPRSRYGMWRAWQVTQDL